MSAEPDYVQLALDAGQLVYSDDVLDDDPDSPYEGQYVRTYWAPREWSREQT